jgi:N-glycosylase/DNA lyase
MIAFSAVSYDGARSLGVEDPLHPEEPIRLRLAEGEAMSLESTLRCGQAFRWRQVGEWWYGSHGLGSLALREAEGAVEVRGLGEGLTAGEAWRFLGLSLPLAQARRRLASDRWVSAAMALYPGLRLLRQDPWECLVNFLCSQLSNIPKIELCTERLARNWGTLHRWPEGVEVASLPTVETLASVSESELRGCALGYRAPYLRGTALFLLNRSMSIPDLRSIAYEACLPALVCLPGVGRKVADCVALFSLDKPEAFPVDVWVRRAMREYYPGSLRAYLAEWEEREGQALSGREHQAMLRFAWDRWGKLAGLAQQYLFHAKRMSTLTSR